jgi:hypothetical protein
MGPVLVTMCGPCRSGVTKTLTVTSLQRDTIEHAATYVNVHTKKNAAARSAARSK